MTRPVPTIVSGPGGGQTKTLCGRVAPSRDASVGVEHCGGILDSLSIPPLNGLSFGSVDDDVQRRRQERDSRRRSRLTSKAGRKCSDSEFVQRFLLITKIPIVSQEGGTISILPKKRKKKND